MNRWERKWRIAVVVVLVVWFSTAAWLTQAYAQALAPAPAPASSLPASELINPEDLVKALEASTGEKPLMLQVGSHVLFAQAHIPGSEYVGPVTSEVGLQQLRRHVDSLPRKKFIVLYCGCCPWNHCPNVKPADDALRAMGFTHVKVLYIATNLGADWVAKGYPVEKGE